MIKTVEIKTIVAPQYLAKSQRCDITNEGRH